MNICMPMNLRRMALLFTISAWALSGCNINNEPLGVRRELVSAADLGKILKTTLAPAPDDTSLSTTLNTGRSPYLSVGEAQNVTSEFFVAFGRITGGEVKRAKLALPIHLIAGEGGSFSPTLHRVTQAWQEDSLTAGKLQGAYFDPANIGQASFPALDSLRENVDTDTLWFDLDSTYVKTLVSDSVNVLIRSGDKNILFEFHSRESLAKILFLETLLSRSGKADTTLRFPPLADVFVFRREAPLPKELFYCGNSEKHQTYLRFAPLDSLPANATVNRAILTLNLEPNQTFITSDGFSCTIFLVDTVNSATDSLSFDLRSPSTGVSLLILDDATKAEFNLTSVVQGWLIAPQFNVGLMIEPLSSSRDLQRAAFHTATSNAALAPRLTVDYTTPPPIE